MKYTIDAITDTGNKRTSNQDGLWWRTEILDGRPTALLLVADGMGGLSMGEEASAAAVRGMADWWQRRMLQERAFLWENVSQEIDQVIYGIHREIFFMGQSTGEKAGTTLTLLMLRGDRGLVKQIGDSRAYRIRYGQLLQLTEDQTYENYLIRSGQLDPQQADPLKNQALVNALGVSEELEICTLALEIDPGDRYLLATDGFYHGLPGLLESYDWTVREKTSGQELLFFRRQILNGPARDNLTAILVDVTEG